MKSHDILNKNCQKFRKKKISWFFSNFKSLIWATYSAFGDTPHPSKDGKLRDCSPQKRKKENHTGLDR